MLGGLFGRVKILDGWVLWQIVGQPTGHADIVISMRTSDRGNLSCLRRAGVTHSLGAKIPPAPLGRRVIDAEFMLAYRVLKQSNRSFAGVAL
jgi:hypothetical protein